MARRERYVVGLDVGTSRATAVVGESMDDGTLDIVGIGTSESRIASRLKILCDTLLRYGCGAQCSITVVSWR